MAESSDQVATAVIVPIYTIRFNFQSRERNGYSIDW